MGIFLRYLSAPTPQTGPDALVRHVPRRVRLFCLAPVKSSALLGRREFEIAHLYRRTEVGCRLP